MVVQMPVSDWERWIALVHHLNKATIGRPRWPDGNGRSTFGTEVNGDESAAVAANLVAPMTRKLHRT